MPRSGSELVQCILNQREDTFATNTSPLLDYLYMASQNLSNEEALAMPEEERLKSFYAFCKGGMVEYAKAATDKKIFCDKSRGWIHYYDFISDVLGEKPKIICMVRDLREVVASMESIHREEAVSEGFIASPSEGVTTEERVDSWVSSLPIGLALRRIKNAIDLDRDLMFIRYEDLCLSPEETMGAIEKHFEIPSFKYDFDKIEGRGTENSKVFGYKNIHRIKGSLEAPSIKAEKILGKDLCEGINSSFSWYQKAFNYN